MAEAVFRSLSASHHPVGAAPAPTSTSATAPLIGKIDSAGTAAYHPLPPDSCTLSTLREHGIADYEHAARIVAEDDFQTFDYILAMDRHNLADLLYLREPLERETGMKLATVRLFGDFGPHGEVYAEVGGGEEVQDPSGDGGESLRVVYEQAVRFSNGFLAYLERKRMDG
jgi:low molecular weight phosphotyrosine protein phosphatase